MNVTNRTLFIADNLDIMRGIDSETIDLIYFDPPFKSGKKWKAPIGSPAEGAEFKDIWTDEDIKQEWHGHIAAQHYELYEIIKASENTHDKSMKIYLMAMAIRLFEMKRILKPTGSIYLHCDPTASHYLKLILDDLFNFKNYRNEIVWAYTQGGRSSKHFPRKHDIVLRYTKSGNFVFNANDVKIDYQLISDKSSDSFSKIDEDGRFYKEVFGSDRKKKYKYYKDEGKLPYDWWIDIPQMTGRTAAAKKERTGYPTQKPLALLDRIIKASSNENDVVLDPFCGCATACVAAERLQRQWIGIDISSSAEVITKLRLEEASEQGALFSQISISDVTVTSEAPQRTDNAEEIAIQQKLPAYQTHKPELFGMQQGKCNACQYPFHYRNLTVDHIKPQSKGIDNRIENLQLLCASCNSMKGTRTHAELIQKLKDKNIISAT